MGIRWADLWKFRMGNVLTGRKIDKLMKEIDEEMKVES